MVIIVGSIFSFLGGAVYYGVIGDGFGSQKENETVKQDIETNISDDVTLNELTDGTNEVTWSQRDEADRIVVKDLGGNVTKELLFEGHEKRIIIDEFKIYATFDDSEREDILIHRKVDKQGETQSKL